MKEFYQKNNQKNIEQFKEDIRLYAKQKNLTFQESDEIEEGKWFCQMKKENKLTLGVTSRAVTILIQDFSKDTIKISVGEGKWISKIAGSTVTVIASGGLFLLAAPITVTGIYKQAKLLKDVYNFIEINFD